MMGLLALGFTVPAVLGALLLLPAIWYLLRLIPPRPRQVAFPPTRLLAGIIREEETPHRTPWWLTLLRLLLAAVLIIALAGPIWQPDRGTDSASGSGPYWLVIDNGWAAAPYWKERQDLGLALIDRAGDANRPIVLVATADGIAQGLAAQSAAQARARLQAMEPRSWTPDRAELIPALTDTALATAPGSATWLSDNLDDGNGKPFGAMLSGLLGNRLTIRFAATQTPVVMLSTDNGLKSLDVRLARSEGAPGLAGEIRALDQKGRELAVAAYTFDAGETATTAAFELPTELRNEIARVEIVGTPHAAAVQLLDERWRRRSVGLISGAVSDVDQPLLSPQHFLETALKPFADVREPGGSDLNKSVDDLVRSNVSAIVTADVGTLVAATEKTLGDWVDKGGVLIRFAGPKLAAINGDALVPVDLRQGGRTLGGALSWSKPQALGSFSAKGAFANLPVPTDVTVTRQVLAEQHPDLEAKTWASLTDGTPLVTAARRGAGWIVLFHVTADTSWSNLPLSGSFVEMLRRVIAFSIATAARADVAETDATNAPKTFLPPLRTLDGFGRLGLPTSDAKPIAETGLATTPSREHPPGLYGSEDGFVALEPMKATDRLAVLDVAAARDAIVRPYEAATSTDLKPWVFGFTVVFLILDTLAVLYLNGALALRSFTRRGTAVALLAGVLLPLALIPGASPARAQTPPASVQAQTSPPASTKAQTPPAPKKSDDAFNLQAALATHLAYVISGDAAIDDVARRGLDGLTRVLGDRTALEAAGPIGVDPARDELAFFPLLYWPIAPNAPTPSPATLARIDAYMKGGGTILFDTRDAPQQPVLTGAGRITPATAALRRILAGLDIPELEPVPGDHVLSKSFYLLQDYPGRFSGGQMWVEATPPANPNDPADRPVRPGDGVSPIIITSNDLAGAWAVTDAGEFLLPTVPAEPRQREMAFRVGVNIVMYTLTGNYKADQVHVPALLERLGQ